VAYNIIDVQQAPAAAVLDAIAKVEHVIAVRVI
jgi:D-3-phosphoglycerate dehydrogenase